MVEANVIGKIYFYFLVAFWVYYTVWMLITPLIDADHPIQGYFFDRELGLLVTTAGAYFLMCGLSTMVGLVLIRDKTKATIN